MAQGTRTRADELAAQFEAVNNEIVDVVSGCSADQWQRLTESEKWPVGVVAHHVSQVQGFAAGALAGLTAAETPPVALTGQGIEENNARHARDFAGVGQPETLAALRENGAALARAIRGLDSEHLARSAFAFDGQELTAEQVVEGAVIGHFQEHLESIRATVDGPTQAPRALSR
jgi:hypothetical protein